MTVKPLRQRPVAGKARLGGGTSRGDGSDPGTGNRDERGRPGLGSLNGLRSETCHA